MRPSATPPVFNDLGERAWAAGLFEGEGTIYNNKYQPMLRIGTSDQDVAEHFADVVGGKINGPYTQLGIGSKPMYLVSVTGFERVQAVVAALWSYLGDRRKEKISAVMRASAERLRNKPARHRDAQGRYVSYAG